MKPRMKNGIKTYLVDGKKVKWLNILTKYRIRYVI